MRTRLLVRMNSSSQLQPNKMRRRQRPEVISSKTDERRGHCVCVAAPASHSSFAIGRNELLTMVVIAFLVFYGNSMIAPLVPALARGFGVDPNDLKWLIPSFSLLYGAAKLIYG